MHTLVLVIGLFLRSDAESDVRKDVRFHKFSQKNSNLLEVEDMEDSKSLLSTHFGRTAGRQRPDQAINDTLWNKAGLGDQLATYSNSKPIRVEWLWHTAMCLSADVPDLGGKSIHGPRNVHIDECRNPIPAWQRFDYMPKSYQIRLHYDKGQYCLDGDGSNLVYNLCATDENHIRSQRFLYDAGTDHIRNAGPGDVIRCLNVDAGEAMHGDLYVNGTNVNLKECKGPETNQKFKCANMADYELLQNNISAARAEHDQAQDSFTEQSSKDSAVPVLPALQPGLAPLYYPPGMAISPVYTQAVPYPQYGMNPGYVMPMAQQAIPQSMPQDVMMPQQVTQMQAVNQAKSTAQAQGIQGTAAENAGSVVRQAAPVSQRPATQASAVETTGHAVPQQTSTERAVPQQTSSKASSTQSDGASVVAVSDSKSLRPPLQVESDDAPADPMFHNLDAILGHVKKSDPWEADTETSPTSESDAVSQEAPAAVALALSEDPLAHDSTRTTNSQLASLNEVMGDLTQAKHDILQTKAGQDQDDLVSLAALLETKGSISKQQKKHRDRSVAVGTEGMMRRITKQ